MKSVIAACIRRPVSVAMFTVAACVFGLVALGRLPVNLLPEISYPTLTVETRMPGAAPIEVETLVTRPVEEAASVVPGLRRVTSRSRAGSSEVTLEFVWDTNMDFAGLDVREKLDGVLLPEDAERPRLLRFDPASDAIIRLGVSGDLPLSTIRSGRRRTSRRTSTRWTGWRRCGSRGPDPRDPGGCGRRPAHRLRHHGRGSPRGARRQQCESGRRQRVRGRGPLPGPHAERAGHPRPDRRGDREGRRRPAGAGARCRRGPLRFQGPGGDPAGGRRRGRRGAHLQGGGREHGAGRRGGAGAARRGRGLGAGGALAGGALRPSRSSSPGRSPKWCGTPGRAGCWRSW